MIIIYRNIIMKRIIALVSLFYICADGNIDAQSLIIKNVSLLPNDMTAIISPCFDSNGDTCALIKIKAPNVDGLEFSKNQYIKSSFLDGYYLIYVPTITRRLDYQHPTFLPGQIDLGEYGYKRLKAGKTYLVQMEVPSITKKESLLILKVNPVAARVSLNGSRLSLSSTGIYEIPLHEGTYSYTAMMDDYSPINGTVQMERDENKTIALNLLPIMHMVHVKCNIKDAHVFIDNQDYGEAGLLSLPQGNHKIRIQRSGYIDVEETINIQNNMVSLSYSLKKNKNIKEIHAVPVRIFTKASKIFKNNKRISDWHKSGDMVMMMPGMYEITDNHGKWEMIEVTTIPIDVFLDDTDPMTVLSNKENVNESVAITLKKDEPKKTFTVDSVSKETFTVNGVSFTMIRVDGGTFTMGATSEQGSETDSDEIPAHQVTLSTYSIGETEVTQELWQAVMGYNPSKYKGATRPVERVRWDECQTFISKLNSLTGMNFRLPTEAEWEYAARGGNKSQGYKYSGSNTLNNVAWYTNNSGSETQPVKQKSPNELGIYDMSGSVREWCQDWYGSYSSISQKNPISSSGSGHVIRGGSWFDFAGYCRVSYRLSGATDSWGDLLGFRLAL